MALVRSVKIETTDEKCVAALRDKRRDVVEELKRLQVETETIVKIFEDPEVVRMIQTSR